MNSYWRQRCRCYDSIQATIGIGTLIIFIALVLVAAIASAILLQTAGSLQQQAQVTGAETREDVSGGIIIKAVTAFDDGGDQDIDELYITVSLATGSEPIPYDDVVIHFRTDQYRRDYLFTPAGANADPAEGEFGVFNIHDEDNNPDTLSRLDTDKIEIDIPSASPDETIPPGTSVTITILVGSQPPTVEEITTPDAYDSIYFELV